MRTLVVARWQEDVGWVQRAGADQVLVVQKGGAIPNEGREASTYAAFLADACAACEPSDLFALAQGDPFPHCPDYLDRLWEVGPHGRALACDRDGEPHHGGLPLAEGWRALGLPGRCPPLLTFTAGALLTVTGAQVAARPRAFWERVHDYALTEHGPWVLERLWRHILPSP